MASILQHVPSTCVPRETLVTKRAYNLTKSKVIRIECVPVRIRNTQPLTTIGFVVYLRLMKPLVFKLLVMIDAAI